MGKRREVSTNEGDAKFSHAHKKRKNVITVLPSCDVHTAPKSS